MHYRQTTVVHLHDGDSLAIDRGTGMIGATVADAAGNTVARIEFVGRLEQLDAVALPPAEVMCPACGMPAASDLCTAGAPA